MNKPKKAENSNDNKKKPLPEAARPFCFQPGQSGNPGGRPKKKPITEAYAEIISDIAELKKFARSQFDAACKGDVQAAKEITDRIEGKVPQGVHIDGELGLTTEAERKQRVLDMLREGAQRIEKVQ